MSLNLKMSDLLLTGALLVFMLSALTTLFVSFDGSVGTSSISSDINSLSGEYKTNSLEAETNLQVLVTETSGIVVKEQIYIDERGDAEASETETTTKSNILSLKNNLSENKYLSNIDIAIWVLLGSFIITLITILGFKAIFGDGRW